MQHKTIVVETDDPKQASITLAMDVTIPELLRISHRYVYWRAGEAKEAKVVKIEVADVAPIEVTEAVSSDPAFKAEVVTITKGKQYEVRITPVAGEKADRAQVTITTKGPGEYVKQWPVQARVYRSDE